MSEVENPQAFPKLVKLNNSTRRQNDPDYYAESSGGMTIRDYFAARATEDDIHEHRLKYWQNADGSRVSKWIYESSREAGKYAYADAMLKERLK